MKNQPVINEQEKAAVEGAIADAERRAGAEFVVVLARSSGRYERAEDYFGLLCGVVLALLTTVFFPVGTTVGTWGNELHTSLSVPVLLLIVVGGTLIGSVVAERLWALKRPFVLRKERITRVRQRATDCFINLRVSGTQARAGVLIYVSLWERMVWVMGDEALAGKVEQAGWDRIRDAVVTGIKQGRVADGLTRGLAAGAEVVAVVLPGDGKGRGELANTVYVLN